MDDLNINNLNNDNFRLPTQFTTDEYILKTLKKAMKLLNQDGYVII